jgi:hypothetical protein
MVTAVSTCEWQGQRHWHNSLGTTSFAASRLCVSQFFKPFTTREIPSLIKKGTHAKPQRRKEKRSAESRLLGIRQYPNSSGFDANTVDP